MPEIDVDFHDSRISMNYWWRKICSLDIPKPDTVLVPLKEVYDVKYLGDKPRGTRPVLSVEPNPREESIDSNEESDILFVLEDDNESDKENKIIQRILEWMEILIDLEWEEKIKPHAEKVANKFSDSSWSVDFVRTENGNWVQTDMALYGLYYNQVNEMGWTSISYHDDSCPHNLEHNPPDNLPRNPKNALKERSIEN